MKTLLLKTFVAVGGVVFALALLIAPEISSAQTISYYTSGTTAYVQMEAKLAKFVCGGLSLGGQTALASFCTYPISMMPEVGYVSLDMQYAPFICSALELSAPGGRLSRIVPFCY